LFAQPLHQLPGLDQEIVTQLAVQVRIHQLYVRTENSICR
jgi:hypothetical protein